MAEQTTSGSSTDTTPTQTTTASTTPAIASGQAPDPTIARFREYVAGGIAGVIVVGAVVMFIVALTYTETNANDVAFGRVKDLLLFVNPLLGVVLGYYFNKVSTEARAESAEQTTKTVSAAAQTAAQTAQVATAAAQQSNEARQAAEVKAQSATLSLKRIVPLASRMVQTPAVQPGTLSAGGQQGSGIDANAMLRQELVAALEEARQWLGGS